jgi:hypothetical protein
LAGREKDVQMCEYADVGMKKYSYRAVVGAVTTGVRNCRCLEWLLHKYQLIKAHILFIVRVLMPIK